MKQRLPLILSAAAFLVALLGFTPLGEAAREAIPPFARRAGFATNAGAVNGIHASRLARPGYLVALNRAGKFPISVGQVGPTGPAGPAGVSGYEIVTSDSSAGSSQSRGHSINCPGSKKAVGGGGGIVNAASHIGVALDFTAPKSDGTGWTVQAHEVTPDATDWVIRIYVACANVT